MHILDNKVGCQPWVVAGDSLAAAMERFWRQIQNTGAMTYAKEVKHDVSCSSTPGLKLQWNMLQFCAALWTHHVTDWIKFFLARRQTQRRRESGMSHVTVAIKSVRVLRGFAHRCTSFEVVTIMFMKVNSKAHTCTSSKGPQNCHRSLSCLASVLWRQPGSRWRSSQKLSAFVDKMQRCGPFWSYNHVTKSVAVLLHFHDVRYRGKVLPHFCQICVSWRDVTFIVIGNALKATGKVWAGWKLKHFHDHVWKVKKGKQRVWCRLTKLLKLVKINGTWELNVRKSRDSLKLFPEVRKNNFFTDAWSEEV